MLFDQTPYDCRLEWGRRGAREAAERGDILIIVDVLSFSSAVVSALHHGALIYPYPPDLDGIEYARLVEAEYILGRAEAARKGKPTLSPVSFNEGQGGKKYVLASLNGAYCTWIASGVPALLAGSLLNASAAAAAANKIRKKVNCSITIVPCGEQWSDVKGHDDTLRPSVEDYLGAGAILSCLKGSKSPEALVCENAFNSSRSKISDLIWECGSGRELRERGFGNDVKHCSRLNALQVVPSLLGDHFVPFSEEMLQPGGKFV
ncbi:2-phosphosulfolactate phosphatase [Bacillus salacetis]|uniref:2-phosphosulfolactate phosphatase n=1 Tax=Bacillus salacetis TaxID=2315464 RepID=UPI003BA3C967